MPDRHHPESQPTAPETDADPPKVLVLDGGGPAALRVVRSLGRRGVDVTVGGTSRVGLGMVSRYADSRYVYPNPASDYRRFVDDLRAYLAANDVFAVIPVSDMSSLVCSHHKAELEETGAKVAVEDPETFDKAYDKGALFDIAADLDVPTPETRQREEYTDVVDLADGMSLPAVVKYRSKTVLDGRQAHTDLIDDVNYVETEAALISTYQVLVGRNSHLKGHEPIVQEYVPGETTATVVLADEGEVLAQFQERRVRTYPSSGGNSAVLESMHDEKMQRYAEEVIGALEWTGPAMVEFMRTDDGEYYLIEVNGRYWGSVPFAVACGVDFPWLHFQQLLGETPRHDGEYPTGERMQRLFYEDLKWLGENVSDRPVSSLGAFGRALGSYRHSIPAWDDPVPAAGALLQSAVLTSRRLADDRKQRSVDAEDPASTPNTT
ncbi:ATP-grasp domain-containing protein [Haloprofundus salinisoli]|uniref:carboxylate--amine ligase n=1 Tax=Haloprofundus salinisoli TaxID=2876193 RepID=UPI001CCF25A4|nr:ATP-grasp domain-containing protein [Haloprofundus salinisoli]